MYIFLFFMYTINVQIKGVYKIMEIKNILQKLNNQYFKSLKRFEKIYKNFGFVFNEKLIDFNTDYLKIISTIINNKTDILDLNTNWIYIYATINEKDELRILIDSVPANY